jgi:hypothetical protein
MTSPSTTGAAPRSEHARAWFIGLLATVVAAFPVLVHYGRQQWFFLDEWKFFTDRDLSMSGVFAPHNGHWVTLAVVPWRLTYRLFGLGSYLPYQVPVLVAHLVLVLVLWAVMRRIGVRPWIATACAAAFIFYGAGSDDILYAFQFTLTVTVVLGLGQFLLADHDGSIDWRDFAALVCGIGALMASAIGVPMVAGAAVAVFIRRGWRAAALQAVPPAVIFAIWYLAYGHEDDRTMSVNRHVFSFVVEMVRSSFVGLAHNRLLAAGLGLVALVGIGLAVHLARHDWRDGRLAVCCGLLVSVVAFAALTGTTRSSIFGVESAGSSRYIYVTTALLLPLIALGAEALARRWTILAFAPLLLLVAGVPRNVDIIQHRDPFLVGRRTAVTAAAFSQLIDDVPARMRLFAPLAYAEFAPTAGILRDAARAGDFTEPRDQTPQSRLDTDMQIALHQVPDPEGPISCKARKKARVVRVGPNDVIRFVGPLRVVGTRDNVQSSPFLFDGTGGGEIVVAAGRLELQLSAPNGGRLRLCEIERVPPDEARRMLVAE